MVERGMNTGTKVAVIIGAMGGIGRATAHVLGDKGYALALVDQYSAFKESHPFDYRAYACDVTSPMGIQNTVGDIVRKFGGISALVNAAGILPDPMPLVRLSWSEVAKRARRVHDINVLGTLYWCKAVLPHMMERNLGRIVNIASMAADIAQPGQVFYAASKAAIKEITRTLAMEALYRKDGAESNIRINAVAPGIIETPMTSDLPEGYRDYYLNRHPLHRKGSPAEVANAIAWLLSDECTFCVGETLDVSGGYVIAP